MTASINSENYILSSMAKDKVRKGSVDSARIRGSKGRYTISFTNSHSHDQSLTLSSSRQPYEPRVFKSVDGAIAELQRIGLTEVFVTTTV